MNIMELGAIGEFLSAILVMGSLVFVGLQIRRNTTATKAASHHAVTDSFNATNLVLAREPLLADLWRRGREDRASLDESERIQFDMLQLSVFRIFETIFYQSRAGTGERRLLVAEERGLRAALTTFPGIQAWWRENPYSFDQEFRDYVDSFLPEPS